MTTIAGVTLFDRPVDQVFDFLADSSNEPPYNPLILPAWMTTPGPIGPGTRFVQRARSFGRVGQVDIELVEYRRPEHLGWAIRSPGMTSGRRSRAADGGLGLPGRVDLGFPAAGGLAAVGAAADGARRAPGGAPHLGAHPCIV